MFTTESALVKIWARNTKPNGHYEREQVPKLSNLQEKVYEVLDAELPPPIEPPIEPPTEPTPSE